MANAPSDAIQRLIDVVAQLRDPTTGCPWDLEQTHASLVPYVLEEAHEVADAIRQGSDAEMKEELGDLLLQVVLHAQIAREQQRFDLDAIADGISDKLIRRHPHVFGDAVASTSDEVRRSWEAIKLQEQAEALAGSSSPLSDRLRTKVRGLPALAGAMTISKKAAKAGFEWDDMAGVWEKRQRSCPGGTGRSAVHPGECGPLVQHRTRGGSRRHESTLPRPLLPR